MANFVYFGSIFATRFKAGKDLRITDSTETQMKAPWLIGNSKFIAAQPYNLSLTPKFLAGERLGSGKVVSMDGSRFLCRLPVIYGNDGHMESSPDYELLQAWKATVKPGKNFQIFARHSPSDPYIEAVNVMTSWDISGSGSYEVRFLVQPTQGLPDNMFAWTGFLPILEPLPEYSPDALVGQQVTVIMPDDTLRGKLLESMDYDLLLRPSQAYQEDHLPLGRWGQWQENGDILLDRSAVVQIFPADA